MANVKDGFDQGSSLPRQRAADGFEGAGGRESQAAEESRLVDALAAALLGKDVEAKFQAAQKLVDLGMIPEAIEGYQTIAEQHPKSEVLSLERIGDALMSMGQLENAAESFDDAIVAGAVGIDQVRLHAKVERALELLERQPLGVELP